ncbi:molybdopterin dinucleotide binding domain-containing protein, partial [Propionibacterium freudenreichii]|uniref:molybdopterin dinucleotide binding domain-containing protein n=2 Tax=Propionibacterium freudenreichii TaxID=1744 RepID=UPI0025503EDB
PAFEAVEISDLSLNDNPTRAIRTLHRSDPRRPGVLLRRYDTTIGHHYKARTHSTYGNVDWMKEAHRQQAWINILDARNRGIADGDQVFLYNDRGTIRLEAKVTERIMPGVISVPQGAWYAPKSADEVKPPPGANPERPVDTAGSVNSLTSLHPSPLARGNAVHTTIANVVKA